MDTLLSTGAAARQLGVSVKTLQCWDRDGRLVPMARSRRQLRTALENEHAVGAPDQD
jgi:predicted site-specific integrase-resolvase